MVSTTQHTHQQTPVDANDGGKDWANNEDKARRTKEDAITDRQFERMVQATYQMDGDYFARECRLVLYCCGRLGMRPSEVAHMTEEWVNWEDERIEIPTYDQCTDGRYGGICAHCKANAEQMAAVRTANALDQHYENVTPADALEPGGDARECYVSPEPFYDQMWSPKTECGSRKIPYAKGSMRPALAIEDYFTHYDEFEASRGVVNKRVTRMAERTDGVVDPDSVYPHALRATAASEWAGRGLGATALKSLFGWAQFSTAICYLEESPERLEAAMEKVRH